MKNFLIITFTFALMACSNQNHNEYVWKRNDYEKFILTWKFENGRLITLNTYIDNRPLTNVEKELPKELLNEMIEYKKGKKYIIDYWTNCKFFDSNNWSCETKNPLQESIKMENGKLTWYYWSEIRKYKKISFL